MRVFLLKIGKASECDRYIIGQIVTREAVEEAAVAQMPAKIGDRFFRELWAKAFLNGIAIAEKVGGIKRMPMGQAVEIFGVQSTKQYFLDL